MMLRFNSSVRRLRYAARAYGPAIASRWWSPQQRFVILTTGRTGSELLVSLLNSHPGIRCESELLGQQPRFPHQYVAARAALASYRGFDTFGWKLALIQVQSGGLSTAEVSNLRGQDVRPEQWHELGFRLILSARRNPVKQALSGLIAVQYGHHHRSRSRAAFQPIAVDPASLVDHTRLIETSAATLDELLASIPHLRVTYESDLLPIDRHQATIDRICDYLGTGSAPVSTDLIKLAPLDLRACITNHDEVWRSLAAAGYGEYLDGGQLA